MPWGTSGEQELEMNEESAMEQRDSHQFSFTSLRRPGRSARKRTHTVALLCVATVACMIMASRLVVVGQAAQGSALGSAAVMDQRIDVGGYRLHLRCMGAGSPTVILE